MKQKLVLSLVGLFSLMLTSCGEDVTNNYITYNVEDVTVSLDAQSLITSSEIPFSAKYSISSFDSTYVHQMPTNYTAYFVADETKGQYTTGQVVKTYSVTEGLNNITVPKMRVKVYVTNYTGHTNPNWYTWGDAVEQLPQTSHTLYLIGNNTIDYSTVTVGTVTMVNPYAAVMIKNNQWISSAPSSYDTNKEYFLDTPSNWYILYIRNNNTNTKVPINIPGNPNQHYTLSKTIQVNKIYQYTINGNVLEDDGELNIIVSPLEKGVAEEIQL